MNQDEDFVDLIKSQTGLDWDELKAKISEMPTDVLISLMVKLGLYVNKTLALEIAKRKDTIFYLRKLLQDGRYWYAEPEFGNGWSPSHALTILAVIRNKDALDIILDILRYRGDDLSDWLTEDIPSLLTAFGEDAIPRLKEFSNDETLEAFARAASTAALATLAKKFPSLKPEIKSHLLKLLNVTQDPTFGHLVADDLASFHDPSVVPDIRRAFEDGRMDGKPIDEREMEEITKGAYAKLIEAEFERNTRDPLWQFSRENIEHMHHIHYAESRGQVRREQTKSKKIKRNDPCPCGSGKKYKNCCWLKTIGVG